MKLAIAATLALLAASPAASAASTEAGANAKASSARKGPADAKGGEAGAARKPARKAPKKSEQESTGVSPETLSIARNTKRVYIYAAESCARSPEACDKELLGDAEARFLGACGQCNTMVRCEAERDAIKEGTARASRDPCAP